VHGTVSDLAGERDGMPARALRAMSDLCVHRGTALSLGWVQGDELVCAYHGWRYGADGRCVAIPQKEDPAAVPAKARIQAFRAQERYGLIWVALAEPRWPLPEVPELPPDELEVPPEPEQAAPTERRSRNASRVMTTPVETGVTLVPAIEWVNGASSRLRRPPDSPLSPEAEKGSSRLPALPQGSHR